MSIDVSFSKAVIKPREDGAADAGVDKAIQCPDDDAGNSPERLVAGVDRSHDCEKHSTVLWVDHVDYADEKHPGAPEYACGQCQCFDVQLHIAPHVFRVFLWDIFNIDLHTEIANLLVFSKNKSG